MDKVRKFVQDHHHNFKYSLMLAAALGAFNCLAKPDYNVVLYLYIYYVYYMIEDKVKKRI